MSLRPSGFIEYSPNEQLVFDQLVATITANYEKFGYTHIHTPAVEANAVLLAKNGEETGKQIFGLYGLAQGASDLKEYALHFDLTVPFARYVLDREHELTFPFKRYQIQPVRRGERTQKGRFREFFQCDIDVIWRKDGGQAYLYYDAEILVAISQTLQHIIKTMQIDDVPVLHISNRKLLMGFLLSFMNAETATAVASLIDKYQKLGAETFRAALKDFALDETSIQKLMTFITTQYHSSSLGELQHLADTALFHEGLTELQTVITLLEQFQTAYGQTFPYVVDVQIVRGLDYYTGTVFEAILQKERALGSIAAGGRYGALTGYLDPKRDTYAGVGGSIGISRLLVKLLEQKAEKQQTIAKYVFVHFPETFPDILALAAKFQAEGKNIEIYPVADKLGKQFGYADKKGIPFVVLLGEGEKAEGMYKLKNMQTGEESIHPFSFDGTLYF